MEEQSIEALRELFKPFDIRYNLEKYHLEPPPGVFRKASVLIPLFYRDGDYRVLLTVRSKDLTHHAGYVAFPGGMQDDDDEDEIHTALREAEEEIGLDPKLVDIICISCPGIVRPNSLVYPVIALVRPDFKLKINETEVSMVFDLPVSRFLSKERLEIRDFKASDIKSTSNSGIVYHTHHFLDNIDGVEVDTWGFTASFCVYTALVLYQSDETFNMINDQIYTKDNVFNAFHTKMVISSLSNVQSKI